MAVARPNPPAAFKAVIFALLACDAAVYLFTGAPGKALDAAAWLALLVLFELETGLGGRLHAVTTRVLRVARLAAAMAVAAAGLGYVAQKEWLDAVNTALWIAVVVLLEAEVRFPGAVATRRTAFTSTAAVLYAGLAVLVLIWAWRDEWFDAYDALLWLIAFATIELDVMRTRRKAARAHQANAC